MAHGRVALVVITLLFVGLTPSSAHANKWFAWLEELSGPGPFRGNTLRIDVVCSGRTQPNVKTTIDLTIAAALASTPEAANARADDGQAGKKPDQDEAALNRKLAAALAEHRLCQPDRSNVRFSVGYEQGWWEAKQDARYDGTVRLRTYTAVVFAPVRALFLAEGEKDTSSFRALEVGLGLSAYRLTGTAVVDRDYWRLAVPLRARVFPSEVLPLTSNAYTGKAKTVVRNILRPVTLYVGLDYIPGELPSSAFRLTDGRPPSSLSQSEWVPTWGFNIDILAFRKGQSLLR